MNANMKDKALRILLCAEMQRDHSHERGEQMYAELHVTYGKKAIERKRFEMFRRGYLEPNGAITQKGRQALSAHWEAGWRR